MILLDVLSRLIKSFRFTLLIENIDFQYHMHFLLGIILIDAKFSLDFMYICTVGDILYVNTSALKLHVCLIFRIKSKSSSGISGTKTFIFVIKKLEVLMKKKDASFYIELFSLCVLQFRIWHFISFTNIMIKYKNKNSVKINF